MSSAEEKPTDETVAAEPPKASTWGDDLSSRSEFKKEKRPVGKFGKVMRGLLVVVVLLILWFGYKYSVYKFSTPDVEVNYLLEQDKKVAAIPEEERGWPLYMKAASGINAVEFFKSLGASGFRYPEIISEGTTHPAWPQVEKYLNKHEEEIDAFLEGTGKPYKGFLSHLSDPKYYQFAKQQGLWLPENEKNNSLGYQVTTHRIPIIRINSQLMPAVLLLAEKENDQQRAAEIINSWLDLGMQLSESGKMNEEEGIGSLRDSVRPFMTLLTKNPGLLADEALAQIHEKYKKAAKVKTSEYSLEQRQMLFEDYLERAFAGGTRQESYLCAKGVDLLPIIYKERFSGVPGMKGDYYRWMLPNPQSPNSNVIKLKAELAQMGLAGSTGSQQEILDKLQELITLAKEDHQLKYGDPLELKLNDALEEIAESSALCFKYWLVLQMINYDYANRETTEFGPSLIGVSKGGLKQQAYLETRMNSVLISIALERYHRENQNWPEKLEDLVPNYLDEIPEDPFDRKPMRYKLQEGKPVVYSVGIDGEDDGGVIKEILTDEQGRFNKESDLLEESYQYDIVMFPYQFVPF